MKKLILIIALIAIFSTTTDAQAQRGRYQYETLNFWYQGEAAVAYGVGVGTWRMDRLNLTTVHGINILRYAFVGIGAGLSIWMPKDAGAELYLPIFANLKGFYPLSRNVSALLSVDIGGTIALTNGFRYYDSFMISPSVGISLWERLNITVGYENSAIELVEGRYTDFGAVMFRLGVQF